MGQTILADTISAKAPAGERVEILTVHSAKGRQWRFVAVVGLQEGGWPNLKARGSLLGSERLVEILSGRTNQSELEFTLGTNTALLDDERRLFHVALTRAEQRLLITAVDSEDEQPSQFFNEIVEEPDRPVFAEVARSLTLPALISRLRQLAEARQTAESSGVDASIFAPNLLSELARAGVRAADPANWWGLLPLSDERPLAPQGQPIRVSPSSVDAFEKCQLRWLLERHGGTSGEIGAQAIGTAIHSVVAKLAQQPELSKADLSEEIDRIWPSLDVGTGWSARRERNRVEEMLEKFMVWHRQNSRSLVGTEESFEFELDRALVRGSIDRLEITSDGAYVVVDLKTGSTPLTVEDGSNTAQLQLYQLAVIAGAVEKAGASASSAGAELLYVGNSAKKATVRSQAPIDLELVSARLMEAAEGMSGNKFEAIENELCRNCNVRSSCPLMLDGRSVIQP